MSPDRYRAGLSRYLAGEPLAVVAADYKASVSSFYRHARIMGLRKRDVGAPTRRKGPAPVVVQALEGGVALACGTVVVRLYREQPERTVDLLLDQLDALFGINDMRGASVRLRLIEQFRRVMMGWRGGRPPMAAAPDEEGDEAPGEALELRPSQRPPAGDWSTWLFLGGRGAGKTLAGASWLADQAEALGAGGRLALIGPTLHDVREVMIEGASGIRSLPRWTRATRPRFQASRRRLVFANGCQAYAFSAEDPDSLRGPQFSAAWADEFCAWRGSGPRGAAETLALLRMGLRLPLAPRGGAPVDPSTPSGSPSPRSGEETSDAAAVSSPCKGKGDREAVEGSSTHPRLVVTTTPRPTRALVRLRDEAGCALSHAPTADNAAHLSAGFLDGLEALYGGTRRAAQELEGKIVELDGSLFTAAMMAAARGEGRGARGEEGDSEGAGGGAQAASSSPPRSSSLPYDRVVVAIDPSATARSDACGLIAAASHRRADGVRCAVVLADRSVAGLGPDAWARRAVALAAEFGATTLVPEVNQGGDMVKAVLKTAGCRLKIREVHATRGKYVRAEPVAALYEQGRIHHAGTFDALEEELMAFGGEMEAAGSLDRADALVWAITDLLIDAPDGERGPRVRWL
ncbi:terminase large subunit domain-containing protein [Brevundimonas basaltis]|uniref:Phage terminase large subunit-like protein n=2 Tax=Brevundimonas basaltis TaxID=472166 RepID=A0A7W8HZU1_9CAUL|nr:phage terminase large subunit-like protein [Brevundimonas basaltis]